MKISKCYIITNCLLQMKNRIHLRLSKSSQARSVNFLLLAGMICLLTQASTIQAQSENGRENLRSVADVNFDSNHLDNLLKNRDQLLSRHPVAAGKLHGKVLELMDRHTRLGAGQAIDFAQSHGIDVEDETVTVVAVPKEGTSPELLADSMSQIGAEIIRTGHQAVKINIQLGQLETLAIDVGELDYVRLPIKAHFYNSVISEGVGDDSWTNAQNWQDHNLTGAGIKVAVIDGGFEGLAARQGEDEIPSSAIMYDTTGTGMETGGYHGCAVAEVIYDMAPNAQLYLIKFEYLIDLESAVDYCISNNIDVINFSGGFYNVNFYDGAAYSSMTPSPVTIANDAQTNGILWVNSAGNDQQGHARASWNDFNSNDLMDWTPGPLFHEINELEGIVSVGSTITLCLTWNDWPTSDQDFDMYLYKYQSPSDTWIFVTGSANVQTGTQPPIETIIYPVTSPGFYGVVIYKYSATSSPTFILRSLNHDLDYYSYHNHTTPVGGSIACPADAASVLAVGAIDEYNYRTGPIESFSSIGPTNGSYTGQIVHTKPDICGPEEVSSRTFQVFFPPPYVPHYFEGTSASAPHIAGAAALVWSKFTGYNNSQVRSYLESATIDLGSGGKDNTYGYGPLVLNKVWNLTTSSTTGGSVTIPGEGTYLYDDGTTVPLTAVAETGWSFNSWSGDLTGSANPETITMDDDYSVTANFAIDTFTLDYAAGPGGSLTGETAQVVNYNTNGTAVTAVPDAGYDFVNWSDASTENPRTDLNVTANIDVTANFAINTYTLDYTAGPGGSLTGETAQVVDYNTNGTAVTAVPDAGYNFVNWSDASTENPRTDLNVTANIDVTANFVLQYTLTASSDPNGTIEPSGTFTKNSGQDQLFTATPNTGYQTNIWYLDGNSIQTGANTYLLTNIQTDHSVFVTFIPVPEIRVSPASYDYGQVAVGVYKDKFLYIYNDGAANLSITDLNGLSLTDFSLINPPEIPFIVEPFSYQYLRIRFEPSLLGESSATLSITNNDSDENPTYIDITGTGVEPLIIFVDANATGIGDGSSWEDAYYYLQDAIFDAEFGDHIWVAEGIYKPDQKEGLAPGDPNFAFDLINGVSLYGGFPSGGDPNWNDRDPNAYETILSGDLNGDDDNDIDPSDLLTHPSRSDNSYHVITGSLTTTANVIDGFVINGGNANSGFYPDYYGGGLYRYNGTISNCKITHNSANCGGGLYNCDGTISNCTIGYNLATSYGGGLLFCDGKLISCIVASNTTDGQGGGLYISDADITGCTIADNYAADYGAGICGCDGLINSCIIWGNVAESHGDQLYISSEPIYSCIQDWLSGGVGNIADAPCLVRLAYWDPNGTPEDPCDDFWVDGDYHLHYDSPCINAGDPGYIPQQDEVDIDGQARVRLDRVDMGADEAGSNPADFDESGVVDLLDFSTLAAAWLSESGEIEWNELCNISTSTDEVIDSLDLAAFSEEWLWQAYWYIP